MGAFFQRWLRRIWEVRRGGRVWLRGGSPQPFHSGYQVLGFGFWVSAVISIRPLSTTPRVGGISAARASQCASDVFFPFVFLWDPQPTACASTATLHILQPGLQQIPWGWDFTTGIQWGWEFHTEIHWVWDSPYWNTVRMRFPILKYSEDEIFHTEIQWGWYFS